MKHLAGIHDYPSIFFGESLVYFKNMTYFCTVNQEDD